MESDIREPLVDTAFNEQDITYVVTAEMPGVTNEDIKVKNFLKDCSHKFWKCRKKIP